MLQNLFLLLCRCGICYGTGTNLTAGAGMDSCGHCVSFKQWKVNTSTNANSLMKTDLEHHDDEICPCKIGQERDACGTCQPYSIKDRTSSGNRFISYITLLMSDKMFVWIGRI